MCIPHTRVHICMYIHAFILSAVTFVNFFFFVFLLLDLDM